MSDTTRETQAETSGESWSDLRAGDRGVTPQCPYCGNQTALVSGDVIYPHRADLFAKRFYSCGPCDAYVGVHDGTVKPLGRLANAELRKAKMDAHAAFDRLWNPGPFSRRDAYLWLAVQLGIAPNECHIGQFDLERCQRVVALVQPVPKVVA